MPNPWFRFKQFKIAQEHCAMKVTTDACIQGAWTPVLPGVKRVLDIGTGTGLLALMLAQRNPEICIDAIEADPQAATQAIQNVHQSPWPKRVNIIEADVRQYPFPYKYDLIISNPPFFTNNLLGPDAKKNAARHTLSLTSHDLLKSIALNLTENGYVSILLPWQEYTRWKELMQENKWKEINKLNITHKPHAPVKRVVSLWSREAICPLIEQTLIIKDNENNYTGDLKEIISPFYLDL
jgi:tRNA1Val (adenine37-N6)-methyltransferase